MCFAACGFDHGDVADARHDAPSDGPRDAPRDVPVDPPGIDMNASVSIVIEAELPSSTVSADGVHSWVVETALTGFTGSGYITLSPNDFNACLVPTDTMCGAYSTYDITIPVAGTYRVIVHHRAMDGANDSVFWLIGNTVKFEILEPNMPGMWIDDTMTSTVGLTAGPATFALRSRETAAHIDSIRLDLQ